MTDVTGRPVTSASTGAPVALARSVAMAVALTPPRSLPVACRDLREPWVVTRVVQPTASWRLVRIGTAAAVVYGSVFPLVQLSLVVVLADDRRLATWAAATTAVHLPLHLHHVAAAARGTRPRHGLLTLVVMTAAIAVAIDQIGAVWIPLLATVFVSAVIVLRPPWSVLAALAVVATALLLGLTMESYVPSPASYYTVTVLWRASSVFVPVWLVGAIRQVEAARRALAAEAVVGERLRIDEDLRQTIGTALDGIATRGERAVQLVGHDPTVLAAELDALVDGSRAALAQARQMIHDYRRRR
jgi:two-component system, NarL family, sensor histidine kinase DesK